MIYLSSVHTVRLLGGDLFWIQRMENYSDFDFSIQAIPIDIKRDYRWIENVRDRSELIHKMFYLSSFFFSQSGIIVNGTDDFNILRFEHKLYQNKNVLKKTNVLREMNHIKCILLSNRHRMLRAMVVLSQCCL